MWIVFILCSIKYLKHFDIDYFRDIYILTLINSSVFAYVEVIGQVVFSIDHVDSGVELRSSV